MTSNENKCPMCTGRLESGNHNCIRSLRKIVDSKSQSLKHLEVETETKAILIFSELKEIRQKIEQLETHKRVTENVTQDLQFQITEIKEIVDKLNELKIDDKSPRGSQQTSGQQKDSPKKSSQKSMDLEEGEVTSSSQSSAEQMSIEEAVPFETQLPSAEERAKQCLKNLSHLIFKDQPSTSATRTFERITGPPIKLNSI
ncbi:Hypothetical predicted protein, partial [Olea europaea subsp. europaea]